MMGTSSNYLFPFFFHKKKLEIVIEVAVRVYVIKNRTGKWSNPHYFHINLSKNIRAWLFSYPISHFSLNHNGKRKKIIKTIVNFLNEIKNVFDKNKTDKYTRWHDIHQLMHSKNWFQLENIFSHSIPLLARVTDQF